MFEVIMKNIVMVAWFLFPLTLCRASDIIFGSLIAYKSIDIKFDYKVILESVMRTVLMLVGLALFVCGVVSLPEIMKSYNVTLVNPDVLSEMINIAMVVTLLVATTVTYGKDAFEKLTVILGKKK